MAIDLASVEPVTSSKGRARPRAANEPAAVGFDLPYAAAIEALLITVRATARMHKLAAVRGRDEFPACGCKYDARGFVEPCKIGEAWAQAHASAYATVRGLIVNDADSEDWDGARRAVPRYLAWLDELATLAPCFTTTVPAGFIAP